MRNRALAFGCLTIGGALALIGTSQPWWRVVGEGVVVRFSGTEATGGLSQALAIAALAGTLLMLALRTRGRRVTGVLLLLVGTAIAAVGGLRLRPSADTVRSEVRAVSLANESQLDATAWPWVFAVSGVLVAVGAALTVITAGTWPSGSDRFQPGSTKAEGSILDDPAELWKALDAGVDPTDARVGPTNPTGDAQAAGKIPDDHNTAKVADPNVHDRAAGDTMEGTGRQERGA